MTLTEKVGQLSQGVIRPAAADPQDSRRPDPVRCGRIAYPRPWLGQSRRAKLRCRDIAVNKSRLGIPLDIRLRLTIHGLRAAFPDSAGAVSKRVGSGPLEKLVNHRGWRNASGGDRPGFATDVRSGTLISRWGPRRRDLWRSLSRLALRRRRRGASQGEKPLRSRITSPPASNISRATARRTAAAIKQ